MPYANFRRRASPQPAQGGVFPLTLPYGGWNSRDHLSKMEPIFAQKLDNWYAENGRLTLRKGFDRHTYNLINGVNSLFAFSAGSSQEMFAASANAIFNVTTNPRVTQYASMTNDVWANTMFASGGAQVMFIANGSDAPRYYNGTTWTLPTITGVTASDLNGVTTHKARLWFFEEGTLNLWYLGTSAIAGAASQINLGPLCKDGGRLVALDTWTRDGGAGLDDFFVAITSEGEVVVYQGTDPSSASTWSLVGVYKTARPLGGVKCTARVGTDLLILTRTGLTSLSSIMQGYPVAPGLSDPIGPSFVKQAELYPDDTSWGVIWDSRKNRVIVNVANVESTPTQYVFSIQGGGTWCRLLGQHARSWIEWNGDLYFGGTDGAVYRADTGHSDYGNPIEGEVVFAPSEFGVPGEKHWRRAMVYFYSAASITPTIQMVSDYATAGDSLAASASLSLDDGGVWDEAIWDEAEWAGTPQTQRAIVNLNGKGFAGALRVAVRSEHEEIQLTSAAISAELGREL